MVSHLRSQLAGTQSALDESQKQLRETRSTLLEEQGKQMSPSRLQAEAAVNQQLSGSLKQMRSLLQQQQQANEELSLRCESLEGQTQQPHTTQAAVSPAM